MLVTPFSRAVSSFASTHVKSARFACHQEQRSEQPLNSDTFMPTNADTRTVELVITH